MVHIQGNRLVHHLGNQVVHFAGNLTAMALCSSTKEVLQELAITVRRCRWFLDGAIIIIHLPFASIRQKVLIQKRDGEISALLGQRYLMVVVNM